MWDVFWYFVSWNVYLVLYNMLRNDVDMVVCLYEMCILDNNKNNLGSDGNEHIIPIVMLPMLSSNGVSSHLFYYICIWMVS